MTTKTAFEVAAHQISLPIVVCPVARELYGVTEPQLDERAFVMRTKERVAQNEVASAARAGVRHLPLAQHLSDEQERKVLEIARARFDSLMARAP